MVFKSNKGQSFIPIIVMILIVLLVFGLVNIVVGKAFNDVNDALMDDDSLSNRSKNVSNNLQEQYNGIMDGGFLMVLVLLFILAMLAAYASSSNPVFIVVALVLMIILVVGGLLLSNVYEGVVEEGDFGDTALEYPATDWILSNYGVVSLIMVASMILTMYISNRGAR